MSQLAPVLTRELPRGGTLSVEPGGQIELSTAALTPAASVVSLDVVGEGPSADARASATPSARFAAYTREATRTSAVPAQRRADGPLPSPADFVSLVRDRAVTAVAGPVPARAEAAELTRVCELVVRLSLSCVAAPPAEGGVTELVRQALPRPVR